VGPRPVKALVLGSIDRAQEGDIFSALSSTAEYFRLRYTALKLV
jgi:hypothetical protein